MAAQLKEIDKIFLFTKNPKTKKKSQKLDYVKIKIFSSKSRKLLSATKLSYYKLLKYTLYFIYCYYKWLISKCIYKTCFIIQFKKKMNLKFKKLQIKKARIILLSKKNTLYWKTYKNYLEISKTVQFFRLILSTKYKLKRKKLGF